MPRAVRAALVAVALLGLPPGAGRGWGADLAPDTASGVAPVIPGVGSHDPRIRVGVATLPWQALVKLQATSGNLYESCTGTLVAPTLVLTAAHCVYNPRTRRDFVPRFFHVLVGFDRGHYAGHSVARRIEMAPGYDPRRPAATRGDDWALVTLKTPLGAGGRTLPILDGVPPVGTRVMLGGYSQDHPLILMADTACRIVQRLADHEGHAFLRHDCAGSSGVSGAPLLVARDGHWYVAAIAVAAEMGTASGLAVVPDAAKAAIARALSGRIVKTRARADIGRDGAQHP